MKTVKSLNSWKSLTTILIGTSNFFGIKTNLSTFIILNLTTILVPYSTLSKYYVAGGIHDKYLQSLEVTVEFFKDDFRVLRHNVSCLRAPHHGLYKVL